MKNIFFAISLLTSCLLLNGCAGFIIGQTTSAAVAVAKVPFKVAGGAADLVLGDD